jgi:hypothetical protein
MLQKSGTAVILDENDLTPESLRESVEAIVKKPIVKTRGLVNEDAGELMVREITTILRQ